MLQAFVTGSEGDGAAVEALEFGVCAAAELFNVRADFGGDVIACGKDVAFGD